MASARRTWLHGCVLILGLSKVHISRRSLDDPKISNPAWIVCAKVESEICANNPIGILVCA